MKTKLLGDFSKRGVTSYDAFKIICAHNEGVFSFSLPEIKAIIRGQIVNSASSLEKMKIMLNEKEGILEVYEDGENITYSIQENEYYTLDMVDEDNVDKIGENALLLNPVYELNKK